MLEVPLSHLHTQGQVSRRLLDSLMALLGRLGYESLAGVAIHYGVPPFVYGKGRCVEAIFSGIGSINAVLTGGKFHITCRSVNMQSS